MLATRCFARAVASFGLVLVLCAFTVMPLDPVETCKAIDYKNNELVCDGTCNGTPAPPCTVFAHSSGPSFCGCSATDPLPQCCELGEQNEAVTTVGDCPSCPASGFCDKRDPPGDKAWEAFCNTVQPPG